MCNFTKYNLIQANFAEINDDVVASLKSKHPPAPPSVSVPTIDDENLVPADFSVYNAVMSFPNGSGSGPDLFRPQHLKDSITKDLGAPANELLDALKKLCIIGVQGKIPDYLNYFFFGAQLLALKKPNGDIRPIAVGNTYRRLIAKTVLFPLSSSIRDYLLPNQFGVGVPHGSETITHSARSFIQHMLGPSVILKLDVRNAFNSIRRDAFFPIVEQQFPILLPFVLQSYAKTTGLFCGDHKLSSQTGVQQGDPLGPALFAMGVNHIARSVRSNLNLWYLDDATIGGPARTVLEDAKKIISLFDSIGLSVNDAKCELYIINHSPVNREHTLNSFKSVLPSISCPDKSQWQLLGSPLLKEGTGIMLDKKREDVDRFLVNLARIHPHQAFYLLRHCLSIPRLMYLLRSSPTYYCIDNLRSYDDTIRNGLSRLMNVDISEECYKQSRLPTRHGGLGIRSVADISLPAYISSYNSSIDLMQVTLSASQIDPRESIDIDTALSLWSREFENKPAKVTSQQAWDEIASRHRKISMVTNASQWERSRLHAASSPHSGAWLHALPVSSLGNLLTPDELRIAVAHRIGAKIIERTPCKCGTQIDETALHPLSCRLQEGRFPRHGAINDIIRRALIKAGIPSVLEPTGLHRVDGRRPDGITLFPWKSGKCLVWDATVVDTFSASHVIASAVAPGSAAGLAESAKVKKYSNLIGNYVFQAVAIETGGSIGPSSLCFLTELGQRLRETTGDARETAWIFQRLSVAVCRGNAASVLHVHQRQL